MTETELKQLHADDIVYVDKCVFAASPEPTNNFVRCKILYFNADKSQAYVTRLDSGDHLYVFPSRISRKEVY